MRTAEDFKEQLQKRNITEWQIRDCSICGYTLRFMFLNGYVFFDRGCFCVNSPAIEESSFEHIAEIYNRQTNPAVIKDMDIFWGFATAQTTELFNPPKSKPF